jgi:class 3 adenylate cyclase
MNSRKEFHYVWEYDFHHPPEQVWSFVADTNRFNMLVGLPAVEFLADEDEINLNNRRRLRFTRLGQQIEWEEEPFEWVRPSRYGVVRRYLRGPVAEMRVQVTLTPRDGTHLVYELTARPRNLLGRLAIPAQIGVISKRQFKRAFELYNRSQNYEESSLVHTQEIFNFTPEAEARIERTRGELTARKIDAKFIERLIETVKRADEITLARLRPRVLADEWQTDRRATLELCLYATRAGLLELRWELLCPLCRGANESHETLGEVNSQVHCDSCRIDYTIDFDRSVEITFRPNPAIRKIELQQFCTGGPEVTPHIIAQQLLRAGERRTLNMQLETGSYRIRSPQMAADTFLTIEESGTKEATFAAEDNRWTTSESVISTSPIVTLINETASEQLFIFERTRWSDRATTASEVTSLQIFRDLFSREALRPGEQIRVGQITILFTDLRDSTRYYREAGDAPAFGKVMTHFDVLRACIAEHDGAIIKTIGDAVMAVFQNPAQSLSAVIAAQERLAAAREAPPLKLKAGIHTGACIAVTLNDRLDYFGSTVNFAARLVGVSEGDDIIISEAMKDDPAVAALIETLDEKFSIAPCRAALKGFEQCEIWSVKRKVE